MKDHDLRTHVEKKLDEHFAEKPLHARHEKTIAKGTMVDLAIFGYQLAQKDAADASKPMSEVQGEKMPKIDAPQPAAEATKPKRVYRKRTGPKSPAEGEASVNEA